APALPEGRLLLGRNRPGRALAVDLDFDVSGLGIRLRGLPDSLAARLAEGWARFRVEHCAEIFLDADVSIAGAPMAPAATMSKDLSAREGPFGATLDVPEG